jgi:caffeoyl-CoA O-methyltransferase
MLIGKRLQTDLAGAAGASASIAWSAICDPLGATIAFAGALAQNGLAALAPLGYTRAPAEGFAPGFVMSDSLGLSPQLVSYLAAHNPPEHPVLKKCREETRRLPDAQMQISAEQGALMALLARMVDARRAIEVGVFTGYSALTIALALKDMHGGNGRLLACDVSEEWTGKARAYWKEAGVDRMIDLQIRPAIDTLDQRIEAGEAGHYDFAFIDADKTSYPGYYERCLELLRSGGLMVFDNMLWSGDVADPAKHDHDTEALRAVAKRAVGDNRVHVALAGVGDGVLLCVKR